MDLCFFLLYFIAAIFLATIEKDFFFLNIYQIKFILSIIK